MLRARIKPVSSSSRIGTTAAAPALAQPALTIGGDNVHEEVGDDDDEEDTEDLLSSFLPHLFPDETPPCLGDPGKSLVYESMVWGDVRVRVPDYPAAAQEGEGDKGCEGRETPQEEQRQEGGGGGGEGYNVEAGRRLFAHYLWGGGLVVAEGIERAEKALERRRDDDGDGLGKRGEEIGEGKEEEDDAMLWRVRGESVLEVGAGAALPSLIAALAGAARVAITDHPSSPALYGAIQTNISTNIPAAMCDRVSVHAHEWGVFGTERGVSGAGGRRGRGGDDNFAAQNRGCFTRIIVADCLWMRDQHENLVESILWFLAPSSSLQPSLGVEEEEEETGDKDRDKDVGGGVAWVVAGFHTGREIVASFFATAVAKGLVIERIWEQDVNADEGAGAGSTRREWVAMRPGEGPENRARWCVVAFLRKKGGI